MSLTGEFGARVGDPPAMIANFSDSDEPYEDETSAPITTNVSAETPEPTTTISASLSDEKTEIGAAEVSGEKVDEDKEKEKVVAKPSLSQNVVLIGNKSHGTISKLTAYVPAEKNRNPPETKPIVRPAKRDVAVDPIPTVPIPVPRSLFEEAMDRRERLVVLGRLGIPLGMVPVGSLQGAKSMPTKGMPPIKGLLDPEEVEKLLAGELTVQSEAIAKKISLFKNCAIENRASSPQRDFRTVRNRRDPPSGRSPEREYGRRRDGRFVPAEREYGRQGDGRFERDRRDRRRPERRRNSRDRGERRDFRHRSRRREDERVRETDGRRSNRTKSRNETRDRREEPEKRDAPPSDVAKTAIPSKNRDRPIEENVRLPEDASAIGRKSTATPSVDVPKREIAKKREDAIGRKSNEASSIDVPKREIAKKPELADDETESNEESKRVLEEIARDEEAYSKSFKRDCFAPVQSSKPFETIEFLRNMKSKDDSREDFDSSDGDDEIARNGSDSPTDLPAVEDHLVADDSMVRLKDISFARELSVDTITLLNLPNKHIDEKCIRQTKCEAKLRYSENTKFCDCSIERREIFKRIAENVHKNFDTGTLQEKQSSCRDRKWYSRMGEFLTSRSVSSEKINESLIKSETHSTGDIFLTLRENNETGSSKDKDVAESEIHSKKQNSKNTNPQRDKLEIQLNIGSLNKEYEKFIGAVCSDNNFSQLEETMQHNMIAPVEKINLKSPIDRREGALKESPVPMTTDVISPIKEYLPINTVTSNLTNLEEFQAMKVIDTHKNKTSYSSDSLSDKSTSSTSSPSSSSSTSSSSLSSLSLSEVSMSSSSDSETSSFPNIKKWKEKQKQKIKKKLTRKLVKKFKKHKMLRVLKKYKKMKKMMKRKKNKSSVENRFDKGCTKDSILELMSEEKLKKKRGMRNKKIFKKPMHSSSNSSSESSTDSSENEQIMSEHNFNDMFTNIDQEITSSINNDTNVANYSATDKIVKRYFNAEVINVTELESNFVCNNSIDAVKVEKEINRKSNQNIQLSPNSNKNLTRSTNYSYTNNEWEDDYAKYEYKDEKPTDVPADEEYNHSEITNEIHPIPTISDVYKFQSKENDGLSWDWSNSEDNYKNRWETNRRSPDSSILVEVPISHNNSDLIDYKHQTKSINSNSTFSENKDIAEVNPCEENFDEQTFSSNVSVAEKTNEDDVDEADRERAEIDPIAIHIPPPPERGILIGPDSRIPKETDGPRSKRVSFVDGFTPGQDSDLEEDCASAKKRRKPNDVGGERRTLAGHAHPVPPTWPDRRDPWDEFPPPPPPPGSPPSDVRFYCSRDAIVVVPMPNRIEAAS